MHKVSVWLLAQFGIDHSTRNNKDTPFEDNEHLANLTPFWEDLYNPKYKINSRYKDDEEIRRETKIKQFWKDVKAHDKEFHP